MTDRPERSLLQRDILLPAVLSSLVKLDPRQVIRNPVMFVVEVGAILTTLIWLVQLFGGDAPGGGGDPAWFTFVVAFFLWLTVAFGNFAEAIAEGRGKAQADALRAMRSETVATLRDGSTKAASALTRGDVVVVETGQVIPGDGTVIEGIASVDESAITGESAPVIREAGGDRSAVTGGTRVLSDRIVVEITQEPGQSFIDRMIALVEGAARRKTPNEIALGILLAGLTIVFLVVVVTLKPFADFAGSPVSITVLIALLVALIPTTIGALLSAIGIAGMDRLVRRNVLALSGRAVEASGDVDVLLLDKTGTITLGNRQAAAFIPMPGVSEADLAEAAQLSSLADETPEGRSIVVMAKQYGIREHELAPHGAEFVPFTAQTRMSGVDYNGTRLRKGAGDAILRWVADEGGQPPPELQPAVDRLARQGSTPLAVARDSQVLGVIELRDVIKEGMRERFEQLRTMGIRTVMVTGDNRLTAAKIAEESGVDDFLSEATPEAKLDLIRSQQADGRLVAMTGDGTNDAPGARAGRRRRGHEHRHPGGARGGQHGRPRLQSDEADRDRRGRQAAADHARRADHVLDRQRRRQVLRDPARDVRRRLCHEGRGRPARPAQHHGARLAALRDHLRDHLQRAGDPRARAARAARRALPPGRRHRPACGATS